MAEPKSEDVPAEKSDEYSHYKERLHLKPEQYILSVMKLANFVTKLQHVLRPKEEETAPAAIRKGKRLMISAEDVKRLHQYQRKRVVQVTYTGPKNLLAGSVAHPFSHLQTAGAGIRNTTPMPVAKSVSGAKKGKKGNNY